MMFQPMMRKRTQKWPLQKNRKHGNGFPDSFLFPYFLHRMICIYVLISWPSSPFPNLCHFIIHSIYCQASGSHSILPVPWSGDEIFPLPACHLLPGWGPEIGSSKCSINPSCLGCFLRMAPLPACITLRTSTSYSLILYHLMLWDPKTYQKTDSWNEKKTLEINIGPLKQLTPLPAHNSNKKLK